MDISIIIVNYNVKDYLADCIKSIRKATQHLSIEIFVVDNNSTDGSKEFLTPLFPNVKFIWLEENIGFSKANNIAIKQSAGKYVLILNPDTIIPKDTLLQMFHYMENEPDVGISGCKVLNSDGSFQMSCRRGEHTIWNTFCMLLGLQKLFPKSKLFSSYNLTYLSENQTSEVDAISGCFMFCDGDLIRNICGFDERYFMYCEDNDLCKMVQLQGRKIMYFHHCYIIHHKGESTKRSNIIKSKQMYKSVELFVIKFYSGSKFFLFLLRLGIFFVRSLARVKNIK